MSTMTRKLRCEQWMVGTRGLHPRIAMERMGRPAAVIDAGVRMNLREVGELDLADRLEDLAEVSRWLRAAGYVAWKVGRHEAWVHAMMPPAFADACANDVLWDIGLAPYRKWDAECWFPDPLRLPYPWADVGAPPLAVLNEWDRHSRPNAPAPRITPPPPGSRPQLVAAG